MTRAGAFAAGAALFVLPFLQSGVGADHADEGAAHMDHSAHYGGSLLMLGEHHLEIVERAESLEVYVSDANRRPLRPVAGSVSFDDSERVALEWSGIRMVVPRPSSYAWADYRITLESGPPLAIRLPAGGVSMPPGAG